MSRTDNGCSVFPNFLYDRKLLSKLSGCAWKVINTYLKTVTSQNDAVPGASITVQTYGDFLNFNPHLHAIVSDGCFLEEDGFRTAPDFMLEDLEEVFRYEVLKMLKKEQKINDAIIENMLSWHKSGFHVYIGARIEPSDKAGIGNLARYIIRACFSQERMVYVPADQASDGVAKVVYTSKDKKSRQIFNALDWLARLVTHIPGRYEQTVRYYGWYSNRTMGNTGRRRPEHSHHRVRRIRGRQGACRRPEPGGRRHQHGHPVSRHERSSGPRQCQKSPGGRRRNNGDGTMGGTMGTGKI
jgi:hypothetical protein